MSKKNELVKNTGIIGIGSISRQFIALLLLPIYTQFLNPNQLGAIDLISTYIGLLIPIVTIQMEMAVFRFLIDSREDTAKKSKVISVAFAISSLFLTVFVLGVLLLSTYITIPYFGLILAYGTVSIASALSLQTARGLGKNRIYAKANIIAGFVSLAVSILFVVVLGMGIVGVLMALILSNLICGLYLFIVLKLYEHLGYRHIDYGYARRMTKYSVPLIPTTLSWWVISVSDRTLITIFLGLAANGLYAVSAKYTIIFTGLFGIFYLAFTESVSRHIKTSDISEFISDSFNSSLRIFGSLGLVLIVLAPFVFSTLFGAEYYVAKQYVPILLVGALFSTVVSLMGSIYIALKKTREFAFIAITAAILNILITLALLPYIGVYGAAIATVAAYASIAIYRHHDIKKYVELSYEHNLLLKIGASYSFVIAVFYINSPVADLINLLLVAAIVAVLNKSLLSFVKDTLVASRFLNKKKA